VALHITDEETDRRVRELAAARGVGLTEAVRLAVEAELARLTLRDRVRPLQARVAEAIARNNPPPVEDWKQFYDNLEGEAADEAGSVDR
jgi:antitoxin VapB